MWNYNILTQSTTFPHQSICLAIKYNFLFQIFFLPPIFQYNLFLYIYMCNVSALYNPKNKENKIITPREHRDFLSRHKKKTKNIEYSMNISTDVWKIMFFIYLWEIFSVYINMRWIGLWSHWLVHTSENINWLMILRCVGRTMFKHYLKRRLADAIT